MFGQGFLEMFFNNNENETVTRPDVFMGGEKTDYAVADTSFLPTNVARVGNVHDSLVGLRSNKLDGAKETTTRTEPDNHGFINSLSLHEKLDYSNADFAEVPHQRSAGDGFDSLQSYGERGSTQVEELFSKDEFCSLNETFEETLVFLRNRLQIQYARLRKELQSSMRNIVLQEMQKILTTAQQLRDQVLSLREVVKTQERMIARKDQVIDDLMADLRRTNEKAEASIEANMTKTKQLVEHVIDKWWRRRLLQRALIAWKAYLSGTWKNRFLQRMKSEAYAECDRLKKDNENTTKHLENELKLANSKMEALCASHAEECATLKMALMRGVCALNLETLGVFNKNASTCQAEAKLWSAPNQTYCNGNNMHQLGDTISCPTDGKCPNCITSTGQTVTPMNLVSRIIDTAEHWPRNRSLVGDALRYSCNTTGLKCRETEKPNGRLHFTRSSLLIQQLPEQAFDESNDNRHHGTFNNLERTSPSPFVCPSSSPCNSPVVTSARYNHRINNVATNSGLERQTSSFAPIDRVEQLNLTAFTDTSQVRPSLNRTHQPQSLVKEFSVPARQSFTRKAHTVQLGAPAGPSTYSSFVTANVQVHRHEPLSKVAVYDQMKTNYVYE